MKKTKLPNLRSAHSNNLVEFSDEFVAALIKKYGFRKDYPLADILNRLAMFNEKPEYFSAPAPKAHRQQLWQEIEDSAYNLQMAIKALGDDELLMWGRIDLQRSIHGQTPLQFDRDEWAILFESLQEYAKSALKNIEVDTKRGRPAKDHESDLIRCLMKIYEEGTGKTGGYSQDPDSHGYTGPLVEFCERIIATFPVQISNRYIGDTIKAARKEK